MEALADLTSSHAGQGRRGPDFIEALARGLDVLRCFRPGQPVMTLSEIAAVTGLARPTVRRILLTLEELGYVRAADRGFTLTPRVLELGHGVRQLAEHVGASPARTWKAWSRQTNESTSMAQLDGSDIVYVARVAVPKIVTLAVTIGTRFPARGHLDGQGAARRPGPGRPRRRARRAVPLRHHRPLAARPPTSWNGALREVRAKGWALADQDLAPGIRSVATGVRDGDGRVVAAVNVTVHAAETSVEKLTEEHLPLLLRTAADISHDWSLLGTVPLLVSDEPVAAHRAH